MPASKGTRPPNAGKGRPKGAANKVTKNLREMILGALDDAGGQAYLAEQAQNNPAAFMALLGKIPSVITFNMGTKDTLLRRRQTCVCQLLFSLFYFVFPGNHSLRKARLTRQPFPSARP